MQRIFDSMEKVAYCADISSMRLGVPAALKCRPEPLARRTGHLRARDFFVPLRLKFF